MNFLKKRKDGGKNSPVDAYFLIEIKWLFSIAILKFNKGGRESFHTHAFNAITWFIKGKMLEIEHNNNYLIYERSWFPKITRRNKNHRVMASETSYCLTIRGPWNEFWTEDKDNVNTTFTHGRVITNKRERE